MLLCRVKCLQSLAKSSKISYSVSTIKSQKIELFIAKAKTGRVKGKAGLQKARIEKETGTCILIDDSSAKDGFVPVIINGTDEECESAKDIIEQLLANSDYDELLIPQTKIYQNLGITGSKHPMTGDY